MTRRPSFSFQTVAPALIVGLLAFLLTVDLRTQNTASQLTESRRAQLASIVAERQKRTADLEAELSGLRAQVSALSSGGSGQLRALRDETDRIAALSGTTGVSGPGLVVELTDSPDAGQSTGTNDSRIQDVDVQAVVNVLWSAGAEAIAVNGQRLVGTTAIRNAGGAVLVNFRVLTSPYRISAVGDPSILSRTLAASDIARRFRAWEQIYGLGFSSSTQRSIELPAYAGTLTFRYARPVRQP